METRKNCFGLLKKIYEKDIILCSLPGGMLHVYMLDICPAPLPPSDHNNWGNDLVQAIMSRRSSPSDLLDGREDLSPSDHSL
jgi:hypothetical protein